MGRPSPQVMLTWLKHRRPDQADNYDKLSLDLLSITYHREQRKAAKEFMRHAGMSLYRR